MKMHEFKLKDIFEIKKVYGLPIKSYDIGETPYVTGSQDNNGIIGYVNAPSEAISKGGCLTVDPIKGFTRYIPMDFVGRGFSGASINLLYNNKINQLNALYMCTAIEKLAKSVASYTNLFNSNRLANAIILLPVIENSDENHKYTVDDIDFEYMENYISQLEAERISQLEVYLSCTGLDDYELTDEDREVLGREVEMREFNLQNIGFTINHGSRLKKADRLKGDIVFITAGEENQGVACTVGNEVKLYKDVITVDMFGNCFYHKGICSGDDNIYFFSNDNITENMKLFIVSSVYKNIKNMYSYGKQFRQNDANNLSVYLPIISHTSPSHTYTIEDIDFDYMEKYIRAIEKQTIKGVYEGSGRVIEKIKEIVNE